MYGARATRADAAAKLRSRHLQIFAQRQRRPRAAAAGRALGRRPAAGPPRRPRRCSAPRSPTARSPTSSATSPTGRRSSTSARPTSGTRWSGAATATRGEFSVWYLDDGSGQRRALGRALGGPDHARTLIESGVDVSAPDGRRSPTPTPTSSRIGHRPPPVAMFVRWPLRPAMRTGVMAARLALDEVVGVRVPGPQSPEASR